MHDISADLERRLHVHPLNEPGDSSSDSSSTVGHAKRQASSLKNVHRAKRGDNDYEKLMLPFCQFVVRWCGNTGS